MPILNYTTKIAPLKTAGEIQGILASKGAKSINIDYASGEPVALWFKIEVRGVDIAFRLPCNWEGVEQAMRRDRTVQPRYQSRDQAKRVAWRIVKDWVEAQLAIIESGQAEIGEVFLPYAIVGEHGQTLFQKIQSNPKLLTTGEGPPTQQRDTIEEELL